MREQLARRVALTIGAAALLLDGGAVVLLVQDRSIWVEQANLVNNVYAIYAMAIAFTAVGWLVVSRDVRNAVGWVLLVVAFLAALTSFLADYSMHSFVVTRHPLPGAMAAAVIQNVTFFPPVFPFGLGLLLAVFPDGRPLSRRWWPLIWTAAGFSALLFVASLIAPGDLSTSFGSRDLHVRNPLGMPFVAEIFFILNWVWFPLMAWLLVGAAALVVRLRRSTGIERQQVKWVAYVGGLTAVLFVLGSTPIPFFPNPSGNGFFVLGVIGATIGIPSSMAVAILRYRLYDIDAVIIRTLLFAVMAVFIGAVYVAVVVGIGYLVGSGGRPNLGLSIVATALVALAFQPVRQRAEALANRIVYGRQMTPYEVLSRFTDQVAVYGSSDMLGEIARAVREGVGARSASVWVREDGRLAPRAAWPANGVPASIDNADRVVEVTHLGEVIGAIAVVKPRGEPLTSREIGLLDDLAAQAGPVIHNVGLNDELANRLEEVSEREAELRRSRQRIVAAQDAERRRLERDIHDGAQQHLVALAVKLRLARTFAGRDPARAAKLVEELQAETARARQTLGRLSRGIFPPVLAERGLEAAVRAELDTLQLDAELRTRDLARYELDAEAAVYFCCLEALQNSAKHGQGAPVEVALEGHPGEIQFSVRDRGPGFDQAHVAAGSGLRNMRDRIELLGGYVDVLSRPGHGVWVVGRVPVAQAVRA